MSRRLGLLRVYQPSRQPPIITHSVYTSQFHGHPLYSDKAIFAAEERVDLRVSQARSGKKHHNRCGLSQLSHTQAVCRSMDSPAARHPSGLHIVSLGAVFLYRCIYSFGGGILLIEVLSEHIIHYHKWGGCTTSILWVEARRCC